MPNAVTLGRLALAVGFFVTLSLIGPPADRPAFGLLLAGACFIVAAATDALDGYLARRWGAVTRFGRIMDPFADKILIVGAFVLLAGPQFSAIADGVRYQATGVEPWMVIVILGRELLVTAIRAVLEAEGKDFSAMRSGKLKMILQACVVPIVLAVLAVVDCAPGTIGRTVIDAAVLLTVAATALSAWPYLVRGFDAFQGPGPGAGRRSGAGP